MKAANPTRKFSSTRLRVLVAGAVLAAQWLWCTSAAQALPQILSASDAASYRQIFTMQAAADTGGAARLIDTLQDKRLLGYVLAQRYLHPAYRSSYAELAQWLDQYASYPDADKIYALALQKRPNDAVHPRRPIVTRSRVVSTEERAKEYRSRMPRSKAAVQQVAAIKLHLKSLLKKGDATAALSYLQRPDISQRLDAVETDIARHSIAAVYFHAGRDESALKLATDAAARNGKIVPRAHWVAGLAAWRLGRTKEAAQHFSILSEENSPYASRENLAAAAYWAARANLAIRQPQKVNSYLQKAAKYPHTMYGILANHQLGHELPFNWDLPQLTPADLTELQRQPEVTRMLALREAGQSALAEKEMQQLHGRLDYRKDTQMLALAAELKLPASQIRIAETARAKGKTWMAGLYPVPGWKPQGGFTTDPALLFALIRQESNFTSGAKGAGGARGLMQLMPATASFIGRDKTLRDAGSNRLFDPEFNLTLGQRYIQHLQAAGGVNDLFSLIASYNVGPGTVGEWRGRAPHVKDPLLFVESLPYSETRRYVMRAVSSYWIYQHRMGAPLTALDAIARGKWPQLTPPAAQRGAGAT